jgi:two-component system sensor histidine kinase RegB
MKTESEQNVTLRWLIRLRWIEIVVQSGLIVAIAAWTAVEVPVAALHGLLALATLSNLGLWFACRNFTPPAWSQPLVIGFDITLLTIGLYLSGGPMNPFSFLYVVHVALAAFVVRRVWRWALFAMAAGGYGALYLLTEAMHPHGEMQLHLEGMWVAMTVSAAFIVWFIGYLRAALDNRDAELRAMREARARREKLASLTTLAAGAAHELSTPLATIAVAAREIERELAGGPLTEDAQVIREQTRRCQEILDRLAAQSGRTPGEETRPMDLREVFETARERVTRPDDVRIRQPAVPLRFRLPETAIVEAAAAVLQNAVDAEGAPVDVTFRSDGDVGTVEVRDHGSGIRSDDLERVTEPFFTTKGGRHMGLGLFVVAELMRELGGELVVDAVPGDGTRVTFRFPKTLQETG